MLAAEAIRVWLAGSGLILIIFLILHLGGVLLAVVAPANFEVYATQIHAAPWLPLAEWGLLLVVVIHVILTLLKRIVSRRNGNVAMLRSRRSDPWGSFAARSQAIGGVLTLVFLLMHLSQLRWPRPEAGAELLALREVLRQPISLAVYLAAAGLMGVHLLHGGEAAHRSLGLLDPGNAGLIRRSSRVLALVVSAGFAMAVVLIAAPMLLAPQP